MAGVVRWEDEGLVAEERGAEVAMEMGDMMRWGESVDTGVGEEGLEEEEIQVAAEGVVGEEMVPEADWGALGDCTVADCKEDQGAQELVRLVAEEVVTMVAGEREANFDEATTGCRCREYSVLHSKLENSDASKIEEQIRICLPCCEVYLHLPLMVAHPAKLSACQGRSAARLVVAACLALVRCGQSQAECSDSLESCILWAQQAECSRNPAFMHVRCRKACGLCSEGTGGEAASVRASQDASTKEESGRDVERRRDTSDEAEAEGDRNEEGDPSLRANEKGPSALGQNEPTGLQVNALSGEQLNMVKGDGRGVAQQMASDESEESDALSWLRGPIEAMLWALGAVLLSVAWVGWQRARRGNERRRRMKPAAPRAIGVAAAEEIRARRLARWPTPPRTTAQTLDAASRRRDRSDQPQPRSVHSRPLTSQVKDVPSPSRCAGVREAPDYASACVREEQSTASCSVYSPPREPSSVVSSAHEPPSPHMPRERVRHGCEQSGRGEEGEEPPPPPAESYEVGWQHAFSAAEEGGALLDLVQSLMRRPEVAALRIASHSAQARFWATEFTLGPGSAVVVASESVGCIVLRERRLPATKLIATLSDAVNSVASRSVIRAERFLVEAARDFRPPTPPLIRDPLADHRALVAEQDAQYAAALAEDERAAAEEAIEADVKACSALALGNRGGLLKEQPNDAGARGSGES
ncbi:MAG: hypothetical protein SGPRY_001368 [Prymnesium sp.]